LRVTVELTGPKLAPAAVAMAQATTEAASGGESEGAPAEADPAGEVKAPEAPQAEPASSEAQPVRDPSTGRYREPSTGRFVKNPNPTEPTPAVTERVHGNSRASEETAYLYRLEDRATGEHLKWGVTDDPAHRYTAEFMSDKRIVIEEQGARGDMLDLEREMVELDPGRLNSEPWAGAQVREEVVSSRVDDALP
jgi:hypothetical protein